jgi:hypothetical protein
MSNLNQKGSTTGGREKVFLKWNQKPEANHMLQDQPATRELQEEYGMPNSNSRVIPQGRREKDINKKLLFKSKTITRG